MHSSRGMVLVMTFTTLLALCELTYSMSHYPRAETQADPVVEGSFNVIFYGGTFLNDPATVAVLDLEGDDYILKPFTSEYNYLIKENVPAETALEESGTFVSDHTDFLRSQLLKIIDKEGRVIGYEIKPLYHIHRFGRNDVIDVRYWFRGKTVFFSVDVKSTVKRKFRNRDMHWN